MQTITMMWAWLEAWSHESSRRLTKNERGASAIELVLIAGGLAVIAIAAVAIIKAKVLDKANSIPND